MSVSSTSSPTQDSAANNKLVNYECKKTTQALNYLLQKSKSHTLHKVVLVKLLWAADRYHLRHYSRLVSDEPYVAMEKGPVGSLAKDIIYKVAGYDLPEACLPYASDYIEKKDDDVASLKQTDTDYLAETDKEALDFAWNNFGYLKDNWEQFVEIAHKYPEWNKHIDALLKERTSKAVSIDLRDFYKDPKNFSNDPFNMDSSLKSLSLEMFEESRKIRALFAK